MTSSRPWHLWRRDEEMGKKSDDLPKPGYSKHRASANWTPSRMPRRSWAKRITVYALIAVALFFLFVRRRHHASPLSESMNPSSKSWPAHDPVGKAYEERFGPGAGTKDVSRPDLDDSLPPTKAAVKAAGRKDSTKKPVGKKQKAVGNAASDSLKPQPKYDGPISYPSLVPTLRAISATGGMSLKNRNVLFAAASLKSASTLLPMACEMALERQNYVHFVFMGVADVSIKDLLKLNGVDKECQLLAHDARPDHSDTSTENRLQKAVTKALNLINSYMHPQALIVDSTSAEDNYFLASVRAYIRSTSATLIELPDCPSKRLAWMSKLDSSALSAWNKARFDILIQATPTKTANLKRLLESIASADLAGIHTPHITVELPNAIEDSLESFLGSFQWPRSSSRGGQQTSMLSLRRRITRQPLEEEDSSVRFVESFWPTDPSSTHVLVLSAHTEITRQFFQYVKYSLLHLLHSKMALMEDYDASLMGLSFSIPHTLADGTTAFSPPAPKGGNKDTSRETSFLWQRPNSEAMLFTGAKWIELHHFISRALYHKKTTSSSRSPPARTAGKKYPAWLEYALQLSRLRGYYTLYPSKATTNAILGVHSEIPDPPEEYLKDAAAAAGPLESLEDESAERFDPTSSIDMLDTLPEGGNLQSPVEVPLLSWDGTATTQKSLMKQAREYTASFRRDVGGCNQEDKPRIGMWKKDATDLFCGNKRA
ncbi:hypothetical protein E4U55_003546 [Claviceps digitariae]|nr:hypothetical protein E4U55_003546 [Claviceps digitariae]